MTMTTPETIRKTATATRTFSATRQNAILATARAMKKGSMRFPTGPWGRGHRGTVIAAGPGYAFSAGACTMSPTTEPLSGSGFGARHGRWANIGRAFCECS